MPEIGQLRMWAENGVAFLAIHTLTGWYTLEYDPDDLAEVARLLAEMAEEAKHQIRWYAWECRRCGKQQSFNYPPPEDSICVKCTEKVARWQ